MMILSSKRAIHIRASKALDDEIKRLAKLKGLTKKQASDMIAFNIKMIFQKKGKKAKDEIELKFF